MNPRNVANAVQSTLGLLDKLGGKVPADTRKSLDEGIEHARAVIEWRPTDDGDAAELAYAALADGRDPSTDKDVQKAVLARQIIEMQPDVNRRAGEHLAEQVRDHLEAIVAGLDGAYQQHVASPLTEVHEVLTPKGIADPDTDPTVVLSQGPDAAAAWASMASAVELHARLSNAYFGLCGAIGVNVNTDKVFTWLEPADADLAKVRSLRSNPHPMKVIDAGMKLGLTTPSGAGERMKRAVSNTPPPAETGHPMAFRRVGVTR
ncbi:MAG: hypothetical protein ACR2FE_00470 [Aeromicrobium sp.]